MKKIAFSLLTIILISISPSCKKYEEGPALSFRSKKERLENNWKYEKIIVNEEEQVLDSDDEKFRLKLDKEGLAIKEIANASGPASFVGTWEFADHKEILKTTFNYSYFGNPVEEITEYTIVKLNNKDLWLEVISGDTSEYHLIPE